MSQQPLHFRSSPIPQQTINDSFGEVPSVGVPPPVTPLRVLDSFADVTTSEENTSFPALTGSMRPGEASFDTYPHGGSFAPIGSGQLPIAGSPAFSPLPATRTQQAVPTQYEVTTMLPAQFEVTTLPPQNAPRTVPLGSMGPTPVVTTIPPQSSEAGYRPLSPDRVVGGDSMYRGSYGFFQEDAGADEGVPMTSPVMYGPPTSAPSPQDTLPPASFTSPPTMAAAAYGTYADPFIPAPARPVEMASLRDPEGGPDVRQRQGRYLVGGGQRGVGLSPQNQEGYGRERPGFFGKCLQCVQGCYMCFARGCAGCVKSMMGLGGMDARGGKTFSDGVESQEFDQGEGLQWTMMNYLYALFIMVMLVLIPLWDGLALLKDPVWMYMAGDVLPNVLIASCIIIPTIFMLTVFLLNKCARGGVTQPDQTILGCALLFILLLGSTLVSIGQPMTQQARLSTQDLLVSCESSMMTRPLYLEYQALQKLRSTPLCAKKESIEKCADYKATSESAWLQKFEEYMRCSGFCYFPKEATKATKSLYPPALFTDVPLQGSCSAGAARDLESFVTDMSNNLMYEGFFLIGAAVLLGFVVMWATTQPARRDAWSKGGNVYGSTVKTH